MSSKTVRFKSRTRFIALAAATLAASGLGCSPQDGPVGPGFTGVGFEFAYSDSLGRTATIAADSGIWQVANDSTIYTNQWADVPAFLGAPMDVQIFSIGHPAGSVLLPLGIYTIIDTLPRQLDMQVSSPFVVAVPVSGTITITLHDQTTLAGRVDLALVNYKAVPQLPFHLRGSFRLIYRPR